MPDEDGPHHTGMVWAILSLEDEPLNQLGHTSYILEPVWPPPYRYVGGHTGSN